MREREEVGGRRRRGEGESVCVGILVVRSIYVLKSVFFPNICIYVSTPSFLLFVVYFFHCSST